MTDNWGEPVLVAGHPAPAPGEQAESSWDRVSANYLQNLSMPILRGRNFKDADNETSALVAIVNEAFVKRFFKNGFDFAYERVANRVNFAFPPHTLRLRHSAVGIAYRLVEQYTPVSSELSEQA